MNLKKEALSSLLAVSRAVQISEGPLFATSSQDASIKPQPVRVKRITVRGTISNYGDAYGKKTGNGKKKGDALANINAPNPQRVDSAFLPIDLDRVLLRFTMKVMPMGSDMISCNSPENMQRLIRFLDAYRTADGFRTIAGLIAWTTAAALPLWRNRYGIDRTVTVQDCSTHATVFQGSADAVDTKTPDIDSTRDQLTALIAETLSGKRNILMLGVEMGCTIGTNQEVFPSQDFAPDSKEECSRLLYTIDDGNGDRQAALHPQKIWAGLRMIDVWHNSVDEIGPLTIEPLGYSHQRQQAFRKPDSNQDLYSCLMGIDDLIAELNEGTVSGSSHFLAANLMRGGVFSAADSKEKNAQNKAGDEAGTESGSLL